MSMPKFLHMHVKIRHWVLLWFYLGIVCGVIAMVNILGRNLSPTQVKFVLAFGVLHWVLGGAVCYCVDGVQIVSPPQQQPGASSVGTGAQQTEWHSASDFLLPGSRKSLLPPRY
jgi:hypothetical protein